MQREKKKCVFLLHNTVNHSLFQYELDTDACDHGGGGA